MSPGPREVDLSVSFRTGGQKGDCRPRQRRLVAGPDAMAMKRWILVPTESTCDLTLSPALFKEKGMSACAQRSPKTLLLAAPPWQQRR
ncbi:hypothetical protein LEMLEM_LOCUS4961 [Lemmus lemmus]